MVVTCNKVQRIFYIKKIKIRKFKELFSVSHKKIQWYSNVKSRMHQIKVSSDTTSCTLISFNHKGGLIFVSMLESIKLYAQE